jgi:hypothetical protein
MNFFRAAKELYVPPELMDFKFQILKYRGYRIEAQLNATGDFLKKQHPEHQFVLKMYGVLFA